MTTRNPEGTGELTLLLSDVHLALDQPQLTDGLTALLASLPANTRAIYVLGDLFEVWVGDDNHNPLVDRLFASFQSLAARGVALNFCHGNRDFLLGQGPSGSPSFAELAGGRLMAEAEVIDLHGIPTLLMHGDQLCTLDSAYMAFREQSRNPVWQQQMLEKPLDQRLMIADFWRMQSKAANSNKPENIMDVTPEEVIRVMAEHGVAHLVHGHTHRPMRHALTLADGQPGERLVLGDWRWQDGSDDASGNSKGAGEAVIGWASADGIHLDTWRY